MSASVYTDIIKPEAFEQEFNDFLPQVEFSERNPLNTEMFFMWCMIRTFRPNLFIESGTYRGYSGTFICEALKRNDSDAKFVTIGFDLEDCMQHARHRLGPYDHATIIQGDSREVIETVGAPDTPVAFFIDGPKGRNLPALLSRIEKRFQNIVFIAIHDCEKDVSPNRKIVEGYYRNLYPLCYCDEVFQQRYAELDKSLIGRSELVDWKPFHWNGQRRKSYGTETAYAIPSNGPIGSGLSRSWVRARREFRYHVLAPIANRLRGI